MKQDITQASIQSWIFHLKGETDGINSKRMAVTWPRGCKKKSRCRQESRGCRQADKQEDDGSTSLGLISMAPLPGRRPMAAPTSARGSGRGCVGGVCLASRSTRWRARAACVSVAGSLDPRVYGGTGVRWLPLRGINMYVSSAATSDLPHYPTGSDPCLITMSALQSTRFKWMASTVQRFHDHADTLGTTGAWVRQPGYLPAPASWG